jgi:NAD(P)-dependent dehydrogenase (short-subunit alcohol dehydrogenase family)
VSRKVGQKIMVIAGACSGIGRERAHAPRADGVDVVPASRRRAALDGHPQAPTIPRARAVARPGQPVYGTRFRSDRRALSGGRRSSVLARRHEPAVGRKSG